MMLSSIIPSLTESQENQIRACKAYLHQHPEVSWEEFNTSKYIKNVLSEVDGVEILSFSSLQTGVIARIQGVNPDASAVALRADIDGLYGQEAWKSDTPSLCDGKMHACGHDFHTACLIGAALLLAQTRTQWQGSVLLIFQPAEETTNGAAEIIKTHIFRDYPIKAIFGLHNRPEIPTGQAAVKPGPLMAAKINFKISVIGKGGHGSMPHQCIDPIVCAAAIAQNVLSITARNVDPFEAAVLSICSIHGGTPQNLIVDHVDMTGSMRFLNPTVGERALERLRTIISGTGLAFECETRFDIEDNIPAVINNNALYDIARLSAQEAGLRIVDSPSALASEDFADYMQIVPGFFYWLGNRKDGDNVYSWHNDNFHCDDAALKYGAHLLAVSAVRTLMQDEHKNA